MYRIYHTSYTGQSLKQFMAQGWGWGGGLLVKDTLFHKFTCVLDNKSEGILLLDQASQYSISLCVCYLPPCNSSRGDISPEFFTNLRLQVSKYQDSGLLCICGDFNTHIGSLVDIQGHRKMFLIRGAGMLNVLCKAQMCRQIPNWLGGSRGMVPRKILEKLML